MRSVFKHLSMFVLVGCCAFLSATSSASLNTPTNPVIVPNPTLSPSVELPATMPAKIDASQLGISLPVHLGVEYQSGFGVVVDGQYTKLLNKHSAFSLLGQYGANTYRVNGTAAFLAGENNLFKLSLERLSENLPFNFDSGSIKQRVGQNSVGARFQTGLMSKFIQAVNMGGYYSQASGVTLVPVTFIQNDLSYTNQRNIAGSTSGGVDVGFISSLTSSTQLSANVYWDQVNYSTLLTSNSQYNSLGLGAGGSLTQILNPNLQVSVSGQMREIYSSCQAQATWLPPNGAKYDVAFSLFAERVIPSNGMQASTAEGVQLSFYLDSDPQASTRGHFALQNPSTPDLALEASIPAVYMKQVQVIGEQTTAVTKPRIASISPTHGPVGTSVTITGNGFTGATSVNFGSNAATYTVVNDSTINATAPTGTLGTTVNVTVSTPGGSDTLASAYQYSLSSAPRMLGSTPPTVTNVSPNHGDTGTSVNINGSGFSASGFTLFFGTVNATTGATVQSDNLIVVHPPSGNYGTVDVTVTTDNGTSSITPADQFTYPASITSFTPSGGSPSGGTSVTISGNGFTNASTVLFGGTPASSFTVDSNNQITAVSPSGSGSVTIAVANAAGIANSSTQYTYADAPAVSFVDPAQGPVSGGTYVTINGSNFSGATSVDFGGTTINAADFISANDTAITVAAPAAAGAGTVDITVTTPGGTSATSSDDQFTYVAAPTISTLSPNEGPIAGGSSVTITGTNLSTTTDINFGGTSASFTVTSDTELSVTTPAHAAGAVNVVVTTAGGAVTSTSGYTYVNAPTISSISPNVGPTAGGTSITITGTNFTGTTDVTVGGATASFSVTDSSHLAVTTPSGTAGPADVVVTTAGGVATSTGGFTYLAVPTVSAVSPAQGPVAGGTSVTITGSNFVDGGSTVKFGSTSATSVTFNDATSLTATSPAGSAGTVDITVTTAGGESSTSSADEFTYIAAPTVTAVSPNTGPTSGGTSVTITGTGFRVGDTAVNFGSKHSSSSVTVNSSTSLTAIAPASSDAGTVDITVVTTGGTSSISSADHFTYIAQPNITSLSPSSGATAGGQTVTINGEGFTGTSSVSFDGTPGTSIHVISDTQVTVVAPAHSAGDVDVVVTSTGGVSSPATFTYSASIPAVTSVSPTQGSTAGGSTVIITGANFTDITAVQFGDVDAASFTVNSSTQITAVSPASVAGTVDITVTNSNGTSATSSSDEFTYSIPAPVSNSVSVSNNIATPLLNNNLMNMASSTHGMNFSTSPEVTSIAPLSGTSKGNTSITLEGTNLDEITAIYAGGTRTKFTVINSHTIRVAMPPHQAGKVAIKIKASNGVTRSVGKFNYR